MSEEQKNNGKGIKKHRSPNYPFCGLEEAIERAKQVQNVGGIHSVGFNSLMDAWTYKSGTTNSVIAALKAYGLISVSGEGDQRQVRLTDEARKMIAEHSESGQLLKIAALSPPLYKELWEKYDGHLPPSDKVIKEYLVFDRKFNQTVVDGIIKDFRNTIGFANLEPSDKIINEGQPLFGNLGGQEQMQTGQNQQTIPPVILPTNAPTNDTLDFDENFLSFNLSRTGKAQVRFNGQITQEGIKKLIALLELSADTYPTQAELEQPKQAMWRNKDFDAPVKVTGEIGEKDGKKFYAVEGSNTGVPEDELDFRQGN